MENCKLRKKSRDPSKKLLSQCQLQKPVARTEGSPSSGISPSLPFAIAEGHNMLGDSVCTLSYSAQRESSILLAAYIDAPGDHLPALCTQGSLLVGQETTICGVWGQTWVSCVKANVLLVVLSLQPSVCLLLSLCSSLGEHTFSCHAGHSNQQSTGTKTWLAVSTGGWPQGLTYSLMFTKQLLLPLKPSLVLNSAPVWLPSP